MPSSAVSGEAEHDPAKWIPVFGQDHAPTKKSVVIIVTTRSPRRKQEESSRPCGFVECHRAIVPLARASRQNDMSDAAIVDELAAALLIVACAREPAFLRLASLLSRLLAPRCIISLLTSTAALPRRSSLAAPRRVSFAGGCGFLAACLLLAPGLRLLARFRCRHCAAGDRGGIAARFVLAARSVSFAACRRPLTRFR